MKIKYLQNSHIVTCDSDYTEEQIIEKFWEYVYSSDMFQKEFSDGLPKNPPKGFNLELISKLWQVEFTEN